MSWSLRIFAALVEELSLVPTTYMMAYNHLELHGVSGDPDPSSGFPENQAHKQYAYIQADKTLRHAK